jgi:TonB family protein
MFKNISLKVLFIIITVVFVVNATTAFGIEQQNSKPSNKPLNPKVYKDLNNGINFNNDYKQISEQNYANKIATIISSNFTVSNSSLNYKSIVAFQISPRGRIYDVRLIRSSGNGYFDSQSIEAVKLSSPLPPPPKGFMRYINSQNSNNGVYMIFNPKKITSATSKNKIVEFLKKIL